MPPFWVQTPSFMRHGPRGPSEIHKPSSASLAIAYIGCWTRLSTAGGSGTGTRLSPSSRHSRLFVPYHTVAFESRNIWCTTESTLRSGAKCSGMVLTSSRYE